MQVSDAELDSLLSTVRTVARNLKRRAPWWVTVEDLESAGALGLLDALRTFNGSGTLAGYVAYKARGAMLHEIRSTAHAKRARWAANGARVPSTVPLDSDAAAVAKRPSPCVVESADLFEVIGKRIGKRRGEVLRLRYFEGLELAALGRELGVSESRACQLVEEATALARHAVPWIAEAATMLT